jgi:thiol:disulfide interchange protein DsbD
MFMFSIGLVLPFFFLALFPAYLSKLPKSGGWLERTKITMGLLILAASVKYLSNVDQMFQWWILTRERYLAIWIVLFGLAGLYLLGFLRLGHGEGENSSQQSVGLGRLAAGGLLLVFAVSLIPGMFGGRLGEIDAYVPSSQYSGLAGISPGGSTTSNEPVWLKDDYPAALAEARQTGKPILVSFTGYACTNCHWMKANMFTKPEIMEATKNLVLLELYTDGSNPASEANQQLQLNRFGTVAIPYYAIILPDETVVSEFEGSTRNVEEFRTFLTSTSPKLST